MRTWLVLLASVLAFAGSASPQPAAAAAVNSAKYGTRGLPGYGVAQGSMATVFGTGFPNEDKKVTALPLTTTWEGVSVAITVNGNTVAGYPIYMQGSTQFAFIVPSNTPVGDGTFTVTVNGATSAPESITVLASNFGAFTVNFTGQGPGILLDPNGVHANGLAYAVNSGEMFDIWGTGLGGVDAASEAAAPAPGDIPSANVTVTVGGRPATILYKGRSGCCIGLDQVRITIPDGVTGCFVPTVVSTNGQPSNFFTLSIAAAGSRVCSDPSGMTTDDVAALLNGGTRRIGALDLRREVLVSGGTGDLGGAEFLRYNYSQMSNTNVGIGFQPFGSCLVYNGDLDSQIDVANPDVLDAGSQLTLIGPGGSDSLPKDATSGRYAATLSRTLSQSSGFLQPGTYTITGSGGSDIGAFTAQLTLAPSITWTGESALSSVVRSAGQTVTWSGGDADASVNIGGYSSVSAGSRSFICRAPASAGTFTVPPEVLLSLPATPAGATTASSYLFVGQGVSTSFTAPGLDRGQFLSTFTNVKGVSYK